MVKSKCLKEEFVLDFIYKKEFMADIPLEKPEKTKSFLFKHCQQGGALPQAKFLRSENTPHVFEHHFLVLKTIVADTPVGIVADEIRDIWDNSILNVVAMVRGKCYLIGVERMVACNNASFSQAIIK